MVDCATSPRIERAGDRRRAGARPTGAFVSVAATIALALLAVAFPCAAAETSRLELPVELPVEVLHDKIRGGLLGQLLGNLNGLPHEFAYGDEPGDVTGYVPSLPDGAWTDDDTDIEWVHVMAMQRHGRLPSSQELADLWRRHVNTRIWCANLYARQLMELGMVPPSTGMPVFNPWSDFNISGQFACDLLALVAPGMPQTAARIGLHHTQVAVSGEPAQATQLFSAMIATAFVTDDLNRIVEAGLAAVDPASEVHRIVSDVRAWHRRHPDDWRATRRLIRDGFTRHGGGMRDINGYELNTAAAVAALLYGGGDYVRTSERAFSFGWDADCNATVGTTIIGVIKGARWMLDQGWTIADVYRNTTRAGMPRDETISRFGDRLIDVAGWVIEQQGGTTVVRDGRTICRIPSEEAANVQPLGDAADEERRLRESLADGIEHDVVHGESEIDRARGVYQAICLGLDEGLRMRHPEAWARSLADLEDQAKLGWTLFYFSDTPRGVALAKRAEAAGWRRPANPHGELDRLRRRELWTPLAGPPPVAADERPVGLLPERVLPAVADRQQMQLPDRVRLDGWIGTRLRANETNRLAAIDPDRLLEGYRRRPGRQTWDGEHVGKWLHAATLAWAESGDAALRAKLDLVASELVACQLADGYLGTYAEADRWTQWDVWAHKYNLLGLIAYVRYTGNAAPLEACRRMADLLCSTFGDGPGQRDINASGQHKGMASTSVLEPMALLYRLTGEVRYLEFCRYLLRAWEQPNGAKIVSTLLGSGRVDRVGNGKAYEMLSCLVGALEYHRTVGDERLLEACLRAWQDIVERRLYLTGTTSYREFFHGDHDLPNVNNVGETCVTVTWMQFNAQLLRLTGQARFADELEKTVLNHLFGAQQSSGRGWGYYVQLEGVKPYSDVLDGHCCLSSGPRGIVLIPTFATTVDDEGVVVNLFEAGSARLALGDGGVVRLDADTRYPGEEEVRLVVTPAAAETFAVKLRIPPWCGDASARVNGQAVGLDRGPDGYAAIRRTWSPGDRITLRLPSGPRVVEGQRSNDGRLAVLYGPLVLAADASPDVLGGNAPEGGQRRLDDVRVAGPELDLLAVTAEPAPGDFATWPGAMVYRIDALEGGRADETQRPAARFPIRLVPFADAGGSGAAYKVWLPFREPRPDRNLLLTGVELRSRKPHVGSIIDGDPETLAATFDNRSAAEDWFGVELEQPATVGRVVFRHGKTFPDGGWFDAAAGRPQVQVQAEAGGAWRTVGVLDGYPATTASDPAGLQAGERFECVLPEPVEAAAVRVFGKPASGSRPKQAFASCAELEAYGPGY